jgi:hypothetical protein
LIIALRDGVVELGYTGQSSAKKIQYKRYTPAQACNNVALTVQRGEIKLFFCPIPGGYLPLLRRRESKQKIAGAGSGTK